MDFAVIHYPIQQFQPKHLFPLTYKRFRHSGGKDTKAERHDRIYSGMTEAKCHASKRNDTDNGMSLDSSAVCVRMTR